jgi:Pretoxin HINT domain
VGHEELSSRWVGAGHLLVGDKIKQADGTVGVVSNVFTFQQTQEMFNLTVSEAHTFYVGNNGWLVHNQAGNQPYSSNYGARSSDAARREAMRRAGIPISAQPSGIIRIPPNDPKRPQVRGEAYIYNVPKAGGGTQTVVINYQFDEQHGTHWEAGMAKTDSNGNIRLNKFDTPQYYGIKDSVAGTSKIRMAFGGCL